MLGIGRLDLEVFRSINVDLHRAWLDPFFWVISSSGLGYVQALLSVPLLFKPSLRRLGVCMLAANGLAGLAMVPILKSAIPRGRPSLLPWSLPQETFYHSSFPSGHTCTAFAIATVIALLNRTSERRWAGQLAFAWAALVGFSRVYRGVHWPTDVLAAAFGGTGCGAIVVLAADRIARYADRMGNADAKSSSRS